MVNVIAGLEAIVAAVGTGEAVALGI